MDSIRQKLAAAYDLARLPNQRPALKAIELLLAESPDHPEALALYSACLRADGRMPEAQAAAKRALELEPENPRALVQMGWTLFLCQRDKDAGYCADAAIAADPMFPGGWWLRADWALFTGRHAKAEAAARELLALDPSSSDAHGYLGRALLAQGAYSQARESLETALRLDPEDEGARRALAAAVLRERDGAIDGRAHKGKRRPANDRGATNALGRALEIARQRYPARGMGVVAITVTAALLGAAVVSGRFDALAPATLTGLAWLGWGPVARAANAPWHARLRAAVGIGMLTLAMVAALSAGAAGRDLPSSTFGALFALALWANVRALLHLAAIGRSDESLAAEVVPSFGIGPENSKVESGFVLLDHGDGSLARDVFRAVRKLHDYCPDARCGLSLAAAPELSALFPSSVAWSNWRRAPERHRRMLLVVTAACCVGFALGCALAVLGRPWDAVLHPGVMALGAVFTVTSFDHERGPIERVVAWGTGSVPLIWPLAALCVPAVARIEGLEVGVYALLTLRFLWAAGDIGARYFGDQAPDPKSGRPWEE